MAILFSPESARFLLGGAAPLLPLFVDGLLWISPFAATSTQPPLASSTHSRPFLPLSFRRTSSSAVPPHHRLLLNRVLTFFRECRLCYRASSGFPPFAPHGCRRLGCVVCVICVLFSNIWFVLLKCISVCEIVSMLFNVVVWADPGTFGDVDFVAACGRIGCWKYSVTLSRVDSDFRVWWTGTPRYHFEDVFHILKMTITQLHVEFGMLTGIPLKKSASYADKPGRIQSFFGACSLDWRIIQFL